MPDAIKQAFLSSTSSDLKEFREATYNAIQRLDGYRCIRMEDFGARNASPLEICLEQVGKCDLFIGILGTSHGSCPEGSTESYTQLEFQAAASLKKPMLIFVSNELSRMKTEPAEGDTLSRVQKAFLERVLRDHVVDWFSSPEGLSTKVIQAIRNWERTSTPQEDKKKYRIGLIVATMVLFWTIYIWADTVRPLNVRERIVVMVVSLAIVLAVTSMWRQLLRWRKHLSVWASLGLSAGLALSEPAVAASDLVCMPNKPTAEFGQPIDIQLWTSTDWISFLKVVAGEGSVTTFARWTAPSSEGTFAVKVTLTNPGDPQERAECSVLLTARKPGDSTGRGRETGHQWLIKGDSENPSYGLQSYFILGLGAQPPAELRERYLAAIDAYLRMVPEIARLEDYFKDRRDLNVTYLPIATAPPDDVSREWVLQHYDYERARFILSKIDPTLRSGPYLISAATPIGSPDSDTARLKSGSDILLMDLSAVPPDLMDVWIKAFLNQTAQERFTEPNRIRDLQLKMRTVIAIAASAIPPPIRVLDLIDTWIRFVRPK
jgi:hypothetical protein